MLGPAALFGSCHHTQQAQVQSRFAAAMSAVDTSVKAVRAAMSGAGYAASDYHLVLQSYPSPLPRGSENRYAEDGSRTYEGCPMYNTDRRAGGSLSPRRPSRAARPPDARILTTMVAQLWLHT